jgi:uncharacterized cupin superfamily protein
MSDKTYVIKSADIAQMDTQQKTHFLNENAQCRSRSLSEATELTGIGFHIIEIEPGRASTEYHFHYNEDECVYVLSGEGTAQTGDTITAISAGDFLGYPKGGPAHTILNTGTEDLKYIVAGQRLDSDVVEYPHRNKSIFRTNGLKWQVVDTDQLKDRPIIKKTEA